jgi:hypothetical protein
MEISLYLLLLAYDRAEIFERIRQATIHVSCIETLSVAQEDQWRDGEGHLMMPIESAGERCILGDHCAALYYEDGTIALWAQRELVTDVLRLMVRGSRTNVNDWIFCNFKAWLTKPNSSTPEIGVRHAGFDKRSKELLDNLNTIIRHLYPELPSNILPHIQAAAFSQGCKILENILAALKVIDPTCQCQITEFSPPPSDDKQSALWKSELFSPKDIICCIPHTVTHTPDIATMALRLIPWWGGAYSAYHRLCTYSMSGNCITIHNWIRQFAAITADDFMFKAKLYTVDVEQKKIPIPCRKVPLYRHYTPYCGAFMRPLGRMIL